MAEKRTQHLLLCILNSKMIGVSVLVTPIHFQPSLIFVSLTEISKLIDCYYLAADLIYIIAEQGHAIYFCAS